MNSSLAQERLFTDTLTVEEVRGAAFALTGAGAHRSAAERSESLLSALSVIEEGRLQEDDDSPALRRLEAKIDVLTSIISRTLLKQEGLQERELRWSARGAELVTDLYFDVGAEGLLRLAISDKIPEVVQLPSRIIATEPEDNGHRIWVEFADLGAVLREMLDQHLFRAQRRLIAERRRSSAPSS